jgi:hypothetical protein
MEGILQSLSPNPPRTPGKGSESLFSKSIRNAASKRVAGKSSRPAKIIRVSSADKTKSSFLFLIRITKCESLCEPRRFFSARRHDTANETTEVKRKLTASIQKS